MESRLLARAVRPVVAGLEALGHRTAGLLAEAGIARAALADPDGAMPGGAMTRLWDAARALTGDDHLGLHVAEAAPVASFELHGYALLSSPTLREAYRRGCRYQRLIHEVTRLTFEEGRGEGVLRHALPGGRPVSRQPAEFLAAAWVRIGRLVAGCDWAPTRVRFAHDAPSDITEHARLLGAAVRFRSGCTAVHVAASILDRPNPRADPVLVRILDGYAERLLGEAPDVATLAGRTRGWLAEALPDGVPAAGAVAKALGMSVRTLHRRLAKEGTSLREVVSQLRQERALALLARRDVGIREVAFLLGFSELSSFYRAFRRWTGRTPAAYRASSSR